MAYEFRLPDIGEGLHEAEVLQWFVNVGEEVAQDQPIVEVQTDKAAVEIATPVGGKVLALGGEVGSTIKVGGVLIALEAKGAAQTPAASAQQGQGHAVVARNDDTPPVSAAADSAGVSAQSGKKVLAAPAIRKLARELGVDLALVQPSDPRGHVSKVDVEDFASRAVARPPFDHPPAAGNGHLAHTAHDDEASEERHPIHGLRKRIYENMTRSLALVPQATAMDELDASRLVELRERVLPYAKLQSVKLTYMTFFIKAITTVLKELPVFNAAVDDERMEIVYKKHIHIGIATATPEGLLVPVIRHADKKSVFELARELEELAFRARERKLTREELSGSTFTISSTGAGGAWFATPIINYPEIAILGVHKIAKKPVVLEDDRIVARHMMGFSLTFDHRIIDGEPVINFIRRFKDIIENPELFTVL